MKNTCGEGLALGVKLEGNNFSTVSKHGSHEGAIVGVPNLNKKKKSVTFTVLSNEPVATRSLKIKT